MGTTRGVGGCGAQSSVPCVVCDRSLGIGSDVDRGACEAAGQLRSERACAWASHATPWDRSSLSEVEGLEDWDE
jgi:hypothetical protein